MTAKERTLEDRGESLGLMEPMLLGEGAQRRETLTDLTVELAARSAGFRRSLPRGVSAALADLMRAMNCYYSNLIEGHNTHPVDIERALKEDFSSDLGQRNLQMEAKSHIAVQKWIDEGGLLGRATSTAGLLEMHERFCRQLPDDLLWISDPASGKRSRVTPGGLRDQDVKVGRHHPVSSGALPRFLARFETAYEKLGKTNRILAVAAAHHRFLWIHPFLDGNGRVARLMSHAMLLECLDSGGIWSIARGFARQVSDYKHLLSACDMPRRNDLDGRGNLSEEALSDFTRFFLNSCIDQVDFLESLVQPERLRHRVLIWAEEEIRAGVLPAQSGRVLEAVLLHGELPRGAVGDLLQTGERQARRVTAALVSRGVLAAETTRAPLRLKFPAGLAVRWLPGLYPEGIG